jgi:hypothetical protein
VLFNLTERNNGGTRALQPRELYRSQQYVTAVYRSELALRLRALGYEIERSATGAPEIKGYTQQYLEASSPRRQQINDYLEEQGKTVYREAERDFAQGDRIQFTAPSKDLSVANRELGQIEQIQPEGQLSIRTDSGRTLQFNIADHPHLDYGYALTSHSSQGQTADRVLVHVDTEQGEQLVNTRMAYVAVSRGRYDAQIYTDDKEELAEQLGREHSHTTAIDSSYGHSHEHDQSVSQPTEQLSIGHEPDHSHEQIEAGPAPELATEPGVTGPEQSQGIGE